MEKHQISHRGKEMNKIKTGCGCFFFAILILILAEMLHRITGGNFVVVVLGIIFAIFAFGFLFALISKKKQPVATVDPNAAVAPSTNGAEDPRLTKIAELGREATAKKKTAPDEAIQLLRMIEHLQCGIPMHPQAILETRLRIATVLYENARFGEAERLLLAELAAARRMKISKEDAAAADRHYHERLNFLQEQKELFEENIRDWELRRSLEEWPDFERNIYCLAVYSKLRIFYTKARRPDQALIFALAEAYAKYENSTHNEYCDNPAPDFTTVEKLLRQLKSEEDIPQWRAFLLEYTAPEPTCEGCWAMIDAVTASIENAR